MVTSTITISGHEGVFTVQIIDYAKGGLKMKLLKPVPQENSVKGRIKAGDSGSEIEFNIHHLDDNFIRIQFDDDEELVNIFFIYMQTQEPEDDDETILQDVELFG